MNIMITGTTGLVGSHLLEHLFASGHNIQCLQRNKQTGSDHIWALAALPGEGPLPLDSVIHLAGENVADGRWSSKKKERILQSRILGTRELVDYITTLPEKPKSFLCASAIGYYGSRGDELLSENSSLGSGFLAEVCRQWEAEASRLQQHGIRVINLRFGMVLSPRGGALQKMAQPMRLGAGGVLGDGHQFISWISIRDLVEIVGFLLNREQISGPVNVVSPIPSTNRELTHTLARVMGKKARLQLPAPLLKLIMGEMASEMLLASSRVTPAVLLENGYEFKDKSLEAVLRYCTQEQ